MEITKAVRLAEEAELCVLKEKKEQVARHKQLIKESEIKDHLLREQKRLEEKAEDEKILKYNMEKAQKEAEFLAENRRKKEEKEKET